MSQSTPPAMHVAEIKKTYKGKLHVTTLVRRTFREGKKVRHETISNLSGLPQDLIESIKVRLKSGTPLVAADEHFTIERSLPHGNVAAVLGTMKKLGIDKLLSHRSCRERQLVLAMIADRILSPGSKLSCSNGLCAATAQNTLAEELQLGDVDVHELYDAMDWLLKAQPRIESKLAKKHLTDGSLVLFDVSSSFYEGQKSALRLHGYSRDHRGDRPQVVYGLLCDHDGRPIAVEVFPGNTADPAAFTAVVEKVRKRFGLTRVIFVGDRGMITSARIREDLAEIEGFDWVSALRTEGIRKLADAGHIQRSLFDETDLVEIEDAENFPGRHSSVSLELPLHHAFRAAARTKRRSRPGGTSCCVSQSAAGRRTSSQTRSAFAGDGSEARRDRNGHTAEEKTTDRSRQNCSSRRSCD